MTDPVADRFEIHELISRYNRAVDAGDVEGWVDTFTSDGVFESLLVGTFRGRVELREFADRFLVDPAYATWAGGQHWVGNVIVDFRDDDRASVFSYHIMMMPGADRVEGVLMAAHDDVAVRTDNGWRFALRKLIPWPPGSNPQRWAPSAEEEL